MSNYFWVWAQFDKDSTCILEGMKNKVDSVLGGPHFEPHLTLCGPFQIYNKEVSLQVNNVSKNFRSFNVCSDGLHTKKETYEALFIKIKKDKTLIGLKKDLEKRLLLIPRAFKPHISLYYGSEKDNKKDLAMNTIDRLPIKLTINKISVVDVDEKINSWKVLNTYQLLT